jgi:hypothetical protein
MGRGSADAIQSIHLKCLSRFHHLLKTFWGWTEWQLADGTMIFNFPARSTLSRKMGLGNHGGDIA